MIKGRMMSNITMKKEDCILCNGSGKITPFPYRKQKKCDHKWSMGSFIERLGNSRRELQEAEIENERWEQAYKTQIKDK